VAQKSCTITRSCNLLLCCVLCLLETSLTCGGLDGMPCAWNTSPAAKHAVGQPTQPPTALLVCNCCVLHLHISRHPLPAPYLKYCLFTPQCPNPPPMCHLHPPTPTNPPTRRHPVGACGRSPRRHPGRPQPRHGEGTSGGGRGSSSGSSTAGGSQQGGWGVERRTGGRGARGQGTVVRGLKCFRWPQLPVQHIHIQLSMQSSGEVP
jgi:hypothetical protein